MNNNNNNWAIPTRETQRRAAPAARPHPIAGYRAQHHHYSQKHIKASGIDYPTQLHLQRALHRSQSFSLLPDNIISNILLFINPFQLSILARVNKRLYKLTADQTLWKIKLDWLDCHHQEDPSHNLSSNQGNETHIPTHDLLGSPFLDSTQPIPLESTNGPNQARVLTYNNNEDNRAKFRAVYTSLIPYLKALKSRSSGSLVLIDPSIDAFQRASLITKLTRLIRNPYLVSDQIYHDSNVHKNLAVVSETFQDGLGDRFQIAIHDNDELVLKDLAHIRCELKSAANSPSRSRLVSLFLDSRFVFGNSLGHDPLDNLRIEIDNKRRRLSNPTNFPTRNGRNDPIHLQISSKTISRYVRILLDTVKSIPSSSVFLVTSVEVYSQLRGLIPVIDELHQEEDERLTHRVERIIDGMFAGHLDEYLNHEIRWVKSALEEICKRWNEADNTGNTNTLVSSSTTSNNNNDRSEMKKKILRSFKNALLLPVNVVPKTVTAISNVGVEAFNTVTHGLIIGPLSTHMGPHSTDYRNAKILADNLGVESELESWLDDQAPETIPSSSSPPCPTHPLRPSSSSSSEEEEEEGERSEGDDLRSLLSLDLTLQIITINRQALVRLHSFIPFQFPTVYRSKLIKLSKTAFRRITNYANDRARNHGKKSTGGKRSSRTTGGIREYFELVDTADTISKMVEVYSEQILLTSEIDQADFLSPIGRERRGFEKRLDGLVATGLGLIIDLLVNDLDLKLLNLQSSTDFFPGPSTSTNDVVDQPSKACLVVSKRLHSNCVALVGRTDRHILEVFYQEIGLRMHGLICKHIKRNTISINGTRQLKIDIHEYHQTLKKIIPDNEPIQLGFKSLENLIDLFGFSSPKDLTKFLRDIINAGPIKLGVLSTDDLYQLVKRRADWKRIQAVVDKELYGLGVEDCLIA
ncbi:hypothetical protein H4Q26_009807 [Puccinia striiformis f. sp. tritici PST-130]|nr:hypothetical protein H4Q26_009807 [Puccinia striiformis f. sp. tritici PST-130]